MKPASLFLLALGSLLHASVQAQELSPDVSELALKNVDFATSLYRKIASASDDNVFFSPLAVSSSLAALTAGARGATREKILAGLGVAALDQEGQPDRIPDLFQRLQEAASQNAALMYRQADALFVHPHMEVETAFSDLLKKYFVADVKEVDFANALATKTTINDYVKSKTGDKIKEVVGTVDPQTALMLISSVFFQENWVVPFTTSTSQEERFFINKYKIVQVPMMSSSDKYYLAYDPTVKMGALKLPCKGGVAMLMLLPDKDVDYTSIDEVLTGERFLGWIRKLRKTKLEVQLPKFSLEQSYALKAVLPDLGISNVFENADLSGVSKEPGLSLSEMIHKAMIEVKESGTTTPETQVTSLSAPPRLTFNRPFLFVIYHEATNSPLLMGRVIDPTKK